MKTRIGEIDGRPLVISSQPNEIKSPELLVSFNKETNKITDIKKREGEDLMSILDIKQDGNGDTTPDVLIRYNSGTEAYYNYYSNLPVYYMLDNSLLVVSGYTDPEGYVIEPIIKKNPTEFIGMLDSGNFDKIKLSITILNPNKKTEALEYIEKIKSRIEDKGVNLYIYVYNDYYTTVDFYFQKLESMELNLKNN